MGYVSGLLQFLFQSNSSTSEEENYEQEVPSSEENTDAVDVPFDKISV